MTETLPQLAADLDAVLHHAAMHPLDETGWLRVTGEDRVRWLNGMVTNSINDLQPGQSCFNFLLSAQGRIQGTATAFALGDCILLETDLTQVETLLTLLDRFIIMDDVELTSMQRTGIALLGPEAPALLAALNISTSEVDSSDSLNPMKLAHVSWHSQALDLIHAHSPLIPRYEIWTDPATAALLVGELRHAGAFDISKEALEALRLLEGTPRYGTDIRDTSLPQETAQTQALHFAKGCYLGQEIVERIRSRGQVHRTLHGFRLEGNLPAANAPLTAAGKPVGELTSAANIPLLAGKVTLALGTIRREALSGPLTYPGGTAHPIALPYTSI